MHRALLLHAPRGGGKTVLAEALHAGLMGERLGSTADNLTRLRRPAIRNAEGTRLPQLWDAGLLLPRLSAPGAGRAALAAAAAAGEPVLLILDALEREPDPSGLIRAAMDWLAGSEASHLLILCESGALETLHLHPDLRSHALLPLPRAERTAALAPLAAADPVTEAWMQPGLWAASLAAGRALNLSQATALPIAAPWLQDARDAEALAALPPEAVAAQALTDPPRWRGPLALLVAQATGERAAALARALAATDSLPLLLAAADLLAPQVPEAAAITRKLAQTCARGAAAAGLRRRAGAALTRLGDPRTLDDLVAIPAGSYPMGGALHPNSAPAHRVTLAGFRIGLTPVTCAAYARFADETGRPWLSPLGRAPERANHPATDLTWHDARAYCDWLTARWRREGRIGPAETVRLPTEREWEAAARGPDGLTWPWGEAWAPEHANDEETGFNDTCAVGLFPEGASPFGCLDMAGQVWEWCTTLWGPDMAAPGFRYPWAGDGREALDAAPAIRRVLRGGCFSSGRAKANGVYRGSLEPAGFWRGNGFRIVVA